MSSYVMTDLIGRIGRVTSTEPLVYEAPLDASEISALTIAVICSSVSGGIGALNPATVGIEHSFDDGASWVALGSLNGGVITGAGTFLTSVTLSTGLVAPIIRVTISVPGGEEIVVTKVRKNRFLPGQIISFAGTSFLGGGAVTANSSFKFGAGGVYADTFATFDTTTPTNNKALPVVLLADQAEGPVSTDAGATDAGTLRVTIATDNDTATETTLATVAGDTTSLDGKVTDGAGVEASAVRVVEAGLRSAKTPLYRDCSLANLNTGSWTEILAASAGAITQLHLYNGTGYAIRLAYGGVGAETLEYIVPPGGESLRLYVPTNTRLSLQPYVNITAGEIIVNFLL